jgi:hypothetical protein
MLPRCTTRKLRPGLDSALSAPAARSAKQPTRGPHHRAVGTSIWAAQRGARRSIDDNVDMTPHYMSGDMTGGGIEARWNQRVDGSATGNMSAITRGLGAGEDLGEKARQVGPTCQRWRCSNGRQAGSRVEMGHGTVEAGQRGGKWPTKPFPF